MAVVIAHLHNVALSTNWRARTPIFLLGEFMKSFKDFVKEKKVNSRYGKEYTKAEYFTHCLRGKGLHEWLETMRDKSLSQSDCVKIARLFVMHLNVKPETIPYTLQCISRDYHAKLPPVYGILTADYWQSRSEKWKATMIKSLTHNEKHIFEHCQNSERGHISRDKVTRRAAESLEKKGLIGIDRAYERWTVWLKK